jgi:hypothetical protein
VNSLSPRTNLYSTYYCNQVHVAIYISMVLNITIIVIDNDMFELNSTLSMTPHGSETIMPMTCLTCTTLCAWYRRIWNNSDKDILNSTPHCALHCLDESPLWQQHVWLTLSMTTLKLTECDQNSNSGNKNLGEFSAVLNSIFGRHVSVLSLLL